jgi:hypothetical protein
MGISHSKNDEDESSSSSNMTQYDYDRDDSSHHHKHSSDSSSSTTTTCVLDEHVLNRHTIHNMTNLGLSIFADLCGRNRGVFVVPGDGNAETYSCLTFPPSFADGLDEGIPMATSNDVGTFFFRVESVCERER